MNTLVRGQKLAIFSGSGLPHNELAAQVARQAKVLGEEEEFAVVFCGVGITHEEAAFFMKEFEQDGGAGEGGGLPQLGQRPGHREHPHAQACLTAAEYLAFVQGMHVLVILTDMTNYARP
jgi:V/A-type H+-transporting ATPase subunit B